MSTNVRTKLFNQFNSEKDFFIYLQDRIVSSGLVSNLCLIGITGSIGRKEKSLTDSFLNDIDIFVIGDDFNAKIKEKLENELKDITNTQYTDIQFIRRNSIKNKSQCPQYLYDIFNSKVLIYISKKYEKEWMRLVGNRMFVYKSSIITLYITREYGVGLLKNKGVDEFFLRYQLRKVIIAYIESILILYKSYVSDTIFNKISIVNKTNEQGNEDICRAINEYETMPINILIEIAIDSRKKHEYILRENCKIELALFIVKLVFKPSKTRLLLAGKLFRILWMRK